MSLDYLLSYLLSEAKDEPAEVPEIETETEGNVAKSEDTDTKEDNKDVEEDKEPEPTEDKEKSSSDGDTSDEATNLNGNETNNDTASNNTSMNPKKDKERRLALYLALKELHLSFVETISIMDSIIEKINSSENNTIFNIKDKLITNSDMLNRILCDTNTINKSSDELQSIYTLYLKDLKTTSDMLKYINPILQDKKKNRNFR